MNHRHPIVDLTTYERSTAPHQAGAPRLTLSSTDHSPQHPSLAQLARILPPSPHQRGFPDVKPVPAAPQGRAGVVSAKTRREVSEGFLTAGSCCPGLGVLPKAKWLSAQGHLALPKPGCCHHGPLGAAHHPAPRRTRSVQAPAKPQLLQSILDADAPIPTQHQPLHHEPYCTSRPVPTQKPQNLGSPRFRAKNSSTPSSSSDPAPLRRLRARLVTVSDSTRSLSRTHLRLGPRKPQRSLG